MYQALVRHFALFTLNFDLLISQFLWTEDWFQFGTKARYSWPFGALTGLHQRLAFAFLQPMVLQILEKWKSCILWRCQNCLCTTSSYNMILKPIKLMAFWHKTYVLSTSQQHAATKSKHFQVKSMFMIWKSLAIKFTFMTDTLQSNPLWLATSPVYFFTITERILTHWLVGSYGLWEYRPWGWGNM